MHELCCRPHAGRSGLLVLSVNLAPTVFGQEGNQQLDGGGFDARMQIWQFAFVRYTCAVELQEKICGSMEEPIETPTRG